MAIRRRLQLIKTLDQKFEKTPKTMAMAAEPWAPVPLSHPSPASAASAASRHAPVPLALKAAAPLVGLVAARRRSCSARKVRAKFQTFLQMSVEDVKKKMFLRALKLTEVKNLGWNSMFRYVQQLYIDLFMVEILGCVARANCMILVALIESCKPFPLYLSCMFNKACFPLFSVYVTRCTHFMRERFYGFTFRAGCKHWREGAIQRSGS